MANLSSPRYSNIARPYALAAFEYAHEKNQLLAWKAFFDAATFLAQQDEVIKLLANPQVQSSKLFDLFDGVLATLVDSERKNFLLLLAQNKRLMMLPDIAQLFNAYYAELEKLSTVRVVSAIELTEEYKLKLAQALTKRIQREVTLQCEIDPVLLGGAIIHIGDRVIDGSVRGKLTRLLENSLR